MKRTCIAAAAAWALLPALAQETQRIEITGSSIKRIDAETALPVQVMTRQDIQKSGATNVEQLMQTIGANTSSGALMANGASGATTGSISSISLRGLTSLRTLVLINGRRIAPYGIGFVGDSVSVDVGSIPLAMIDRVEVLKDGASRSTAPTRWPASSTSSCAATTPAPSCSSTPATRRTAAPRAGVPR